MNPDYAEPYAIITLYGWRGEKIIPAIKMMRSLTVMVYGNQLGLKEAKRVVDNLRDGTEIFHLRVPEDAEAFVKDGLKGQGFDLNMAPSTHIEDMLFTQSIPLTEEVFGE